MEITEVQPCVMFMYVCYKLQKFSLVLYFTLDMQDDHHLPCYILQLPSIANGGLYESLTSVSCITIKQGRSMRWFQPCFLVAALGFAFFQLAYFKRRWDEGSVAVWLLFTHSQ